MGRRTITAFVVAACASLPLAGLHVRLTAAAFTAQTAVAANTFTADRLANYFSVAPGGLVQPGTTTPIATGGIDTLSLALGSVPKAQTFSGVFTITNVSAQAATAVLTLTGAPQIASVAFASTGTTSATLAAGASTTLGVTTSTLVAGRATGSLRLRLGGSTWLYRDYAVSIAEAPEAPAGLTAAAKPAARIHLAWPASSTTTNLAGYNVYRSTGGGAFVLLNAQPTAATSFDDTSTVDGSPYTYKVQAVSSDAQPLSSVDSTTATATADGSPPPVPTSVSVTSGGGWINAATAGSVTVSVSLAAGSLASDQVTVTLAAGATSIQRTAAASQGAGTITITGIDASVLADGAVTLTAVSTDLAGNVSAARLGTATKDTVAPALSVVYVDNRHPTADQVVVTTEATATVTGSVHGNAFAGTGSFTANVGDFKTGSGTGTASATDAAGNTTTISFPWSATK